MINVSPVILCGGSGTRMWPLSRAAFPKQFLVLTGTRSLFQLAVERANGVAANDISIGETLVLTNEEHRFLALDQLSVLQLASATLLLEPVGRNTAPAFTLAALRAAQDGADPVLLVMPADHSITDEAAFTTALQASVRCAALGAIIVLAVQPSRPETGYGYIKTHGEAGRHGEYAVQSFVEKPDLETAQAYLQSGQYAWNSGIFVLKASAWLNALRNFRPDIADAAQLAWAGRSLDAPFLRPDAESFRRMPAESIDYAVAERCPGTAFALKAVPLAAGWNDLGAWDAVWQVGAKDADGNVSQGDTLLADTANTLIHATSRLVCTVGVKNFVIVETADAVLVADRAQSQNAGKLVAALLQQGRKEPNLHRKVHRPWGWHDSIDEGEGFKVRRIHIKPGASLSTQRHERRAEHWVVVRGTAEVTCGGSTFLLNENQSAYIPMGQTHRLANPGAIPLEVIEVQSGSYLAEDDIVRVGGSDGPAVPLPP